MIKIFIKNYTMIKSFIKNYLIIELDISNKNIYGILDLSYYPNLKILKCYNNQITEIINFPKNIIKIDCSNNNIHNLDNLLHLKNTDDDIYIICSKNAKKNYELMIKKVEDKLRDNGLVIKNYYFISETFYNRNEDQISHKKVRLLLQHLIGLKTEGDKFTDEEITPYTEVFFYDDEDSSINLANNCNNVCEFLLSNTENTIKSKIKDILKSEEKILYTNLVSPNRFNRFQTKKIQLKFSNILKTFEGFKWK